MEDQIPLEYFFPRIMWKTAFQRAFHQFIYDTVENSFPQILWKTGFHNSVDE